MLFSRLLSLLVVFSIACVSTMPAQSGDKLAPQIELEKNASELLEQVIAETAALKHAENRALVYAMAGDALWTRDEKRARNLFRGAGTEIVQVINTKIDSSAADLNNAFGRIQTFNPRQGEIFLLRQTVLRMTAERDAEMALEIMQTTRPPDLAAEMAGYIMQTNAVSSGSSTNTPNSASLPPVTPELVTRNIRVEQEIRLEQSLIAKVAEQDPQKAAEKIREALAKGFSPEIMTAVQRIYRKDAELATKLLDELTQKLLATDLAKNQLNMNFAVNLLRPYAFPPTRPNPNAKVEPRLTLDEKSIKDVANKIADTLMKITAANQAFAFNSALPVLEKLVPERIAQLKQKQAALKKPAAAQNTRTANVQLAPNSLSDSSAAPEKLIADANKAQPQLRAALYRQAAFRSVSGNGDPEKIRSLLQNQPESKDRDEAIAYLDAALATRLLQTGKTDEARKVIDRMPFGATKAEQLIQLALASHRLNTKDSKEAALRLMNEAREMVKDYPEDKDEMDSTLKLTAGFAVIEPERAFTMLTPIIEQANEVIGAQAVLARYNKQTQSFRDGEMIFSSNLAAINARIFRYPREIKLLAQTDWTRTRGLIDQIRRDDVRLLVKLFLAQSILRR